MWVFKNFVINFYCIFRMMKFQKCAIWSFENSILQNFHHLSKILKSLVGKFWLLVWVFNTKHVFQLNFRKYLKKPTTSFISIHLCFSNPMNLMKFFNWCLAKTLNWLLFKWLVLHIIQLNLQQINVILIFNVNIFGFLKKCTTISH